MVAELKTDTCLTKNKPACQKVKWVIWGFDYRVLMGCYWSEILNKNVSPWATNKPAEVRGKQVSGLWGVREYKWDTEIWRLSKVSNNFLFSASETFERIW